MCPSEGTDSQKGHLHLGASSRSTKTVPLTVLLQMMMIIMMMMMMMMMQSMLVAATLQVPLALSDGTLLDALPAPVQAHSDKTGKTCIVPPNPPGTDAAPAILHAFAECGHNHHNNNNNNNEAAMHHRGRVVFLNATYHIQTVMNTTGLRNVDVDLQGTLRWDNTDLAYWLAHSLPVGYQNQSSAWLLGGESVHWQGHGHGTLDGDGQVWYDFVNGTNNYPGRPHQLTIWGTEDSVFEGLRFVQSQMWSVQYTDYVVKKNICKAEL